MENRDVVHRAWNGLRLALLWARKRGVLRRKLVIERLRVVPKYLKCLGHTTPRSQAHYYSERELSFDKTPIFNAKMYRPFSTRFHIPCLNPQVDFDEDDDQHDFEYDTGRKSSIVAGDEEIDERAEAFIYKFYQQLKLQRQISYLQYDDTPNRDSR